MTVPTTAELGGNFSDVNTGLTPIVLKLPANAPLGCTITANVLSSACLTTDGQTIAKVYSTMTPEASAFTNTPTSGNATFQPNNPSSWREDIIRIDYHPRPQHALYIRYLHDNLELHDSTAVRGKMNRVTVKR